MGTVIGFMVVGFPVSIMILMAVVLWRKGKWRNLLSTGRIIKTFKIEGGNETAF